jgi:carbon starvation protein
MPDKLNALPIILLVLAVMAIAYRFYSAFLAARVAMLDDLRQTPAERLNDGQNYHPTHKWILFGHHFAAISGAGPLIGPVLAIQFGYMPGLVWLVVGVCLAGAVQDMLVLAASVRYDGKSLAEIARRTLGPVTGMLAALAILFIVIIALSGLGVVVVKALGGEDIKLTAGTKIVSSQPMSVGEGAGKSVVVKIPEGARVTYDNGASVTRSESFRIAVPPDSKLVDQLNWTLPAGATEKVKGSSWGTFTIACTIPIAFLVSWYLYGFRKGHVAEASLVGALGVIGATVAGSWIPGSALEPYFSLSREGTIIALCVYGFVASVLPVWLLLCPRDYISSFLKIGTIALLVIGIIVANPQIQAPMINPVFANGGGPYFKGAIFPFVFICIMCGAISGFHSLVSSGTTPKMISRESHIRPIGYGAMLLEGLVGVIALLSAASLDQSDYWAINIEISQIPAYAKSLSELGADTDHLPVLEEQVGGESLRGRRGGAVTLAVGMSQIMTNAVAKVIPSANIDSLIKYWYHFAIMFEALFILTTIDTGTRIARFLMQELLGKLYKKFDQVDWMPGVLFSTALVTLGWGGLIWTSQIDTIWPMFGIANQLLAAIALAIVTTVLVAMGKRSLTWVTVLPLAFVTTTTSTAAYQMIANRFVSDFAAGWKAENQIAMITAGLNIAAIVFLFTCFVAILVQAIRIWIGDERPTAQDPAAAVKK